MKVFLIAVRNLFGERGRILITAGGVALAVVLILVLLGLCNGWNRQMTKFLGSIPADFWIGQAGSRDTSHSVSILPDNLADQFEVINGVSEVNTFIGRQVSFEKNERDIRVFLVGMEQNKKIKPYKVIKGKDYPAEDEIIIDQTLAQKEKFNIGDKIKINNFELEISGISSGGNLLIYSYAFADLGTVKKIINFETFVNYYLVKSNNASAEIIKRDFPELEVMSRADFLKNNTEIIRSTFLPIILVLLIIAVIIGIAVIGLTIYTATLEKSQEYGVLKAIGFMNSQLFLIALIQSFVAGFVGLVVGSLLTIIISRIAPLYASAFIFELSIQGFEIVILATLLMSGLAAFIPLRRLLAIDPARVFKA